VTGTFTDPAAADTHSQAWSVTKNGVAYGSGGSGASFSFTPDDNGTYVVTYTVTDDDGGVGSDSKTIEVTNVAPTLHSLEPSSFLVQKGSSVDATGQYSDPGSADTFTCVITWDDGSATQTVAGGATSCTASHTFTAQGTYSVTMKVVDDDGDESLTLTRTEFALLELFMRNPRQVLTRSVIFDRVWGYDFGYGSNSLDVYISYLRKKTEGGGKPRLIHTVRGVGYALREP